MKFLLFYVLVLFVGLFGMVFYHELAHQEIFEADGIESEIIWFNGWSVTTQGESPCETDTCVLSHNINDVVGYHLIVMFLMIGVFGFVFLVYLELRESERRCDYGRYRFINS